MDNFINIDTFDSFSIVEHKQLLAHDFSSVVKNSKGTCDLSLMHLNIRSLVNHFHDLENFLSVINFPFDFIALSEIWFKETTIECRFKLPNYNSVFKKGIITNYGGVALYINSAYDYRERDDIITTHCDSVWVEIKNGGKLFLVGAVYRSQKHDENIFITEIDQIIVSNRHKYTRILISGDTNLDTLNLNGNALNYSLMLSGNGFSQLVTIPTRTTAHSSSCIDHILSNAISSNDNVVSGSIINDFSDHDATFAIFEGALKKPNKLFAVKSDTNYNAVLASLLNRNWEDILSMNDPNLAYDRFISIIQSEIAMATVQRVIKCNKNRKCYEYKKKPYITKALLNSMAIRDILYKQVKNNPDDANLRSRFIKYRNTLSTLVRAAREKHFHDEINNCNGDTRATWKTIKSIISPPSVQPSTVLEKDGIVYDSPEEVANIFNEHFASICTSNANGFSFPPQPRDLKVPKASIFLKDVKEWEIWDIIRKMKSKTSSGWDGISMKTIKLLAPAIVKPFAHITNLMLHTGIFPNKAKIAKVIPIYKSKKKNCVDNYRPVSLLPCFSKILEKIILNRMEAFADKFNILNDNQFGFRRASSTTCSLAVLTDQLYKNMDKGNFSAVLSLDLSKAFDNIEHKLLLRKLEWYGYRGKMYDLLSNYLESRVQYVSIANTISEKLPITRGVPQGAILSPFLYNLFANDIHTLPLSAKINQFADDTSISLSHSNSNALITTLQEDTNAIVEWFEENQLKVNANKTQYMILSPPRRHLLVANFPCIVINNQSIEPVDEIKLLGLTIDCRLEWKAHIVNIIKRLNGMLRLFYDITRTFPKKTLVLIYRSLIESHLSYAIEIWGNNYYSRLKPLFVVQKKFVRIIAKVSRLAHSAPIFSYFNIIPLPSLAVFNTMKLLFKCINGMVHLPNIVFTRINHVAYTRANENGLFILPKIRTNYGKFALSYRAAKITNILLAKNDFKIDISFYQFKIATKIFLIELDRDVTQTTFFSF